MDSTDIDVTRGKCLHIESPLRLQSKKIMKLYTHESIQFVNKVFQELDELFRNIINHILIKIFNLTF